MTILVPSEANKNRHKMKADHFNPATYMVLDRITGEEVDIAIFVEEASTFGWEKTYSKTLADFIGCAGDQPAKLLGHMIKEKDSKNVLHGTQREISEKAGVSLATVSRVFKILTAKHYLKMVRSGCYMISPKIIRVGRNTQGAMLLRIWGQI
jgi:hypothetical protein